MLSPDTARAGADLVRIDPREHSAAEVLERLRQRGADDRRHALLLVRHLLPPREAVEALAPILLSADEPSALRHAAAFELGHVGTGAAVDALADALRAEDVLAVRGALAALGRSGPPEALAAVSETLADDAAVRRAAAWAAALLSHRHGLEGPPWPAEPPRPVEAVEGEAVEVADPDDEAIAECLDALSGEMVGVPLTARSARAVRGVGQPLFFLFAEGADAPKALFERRAVAGVVAKRYGEPIAHYGLASYVLTRPEGDGLAITVAAPNGRVEAAGRARPSGGGVEFEVAGTGAPGARALSGQGRFADGGWRVEQAVVGAPAPPIVLEPTGAPE